MHDTTILALTLAALPLAAAHAAPLQVETSASFDAPPARVWQLLGDFTGLASWHPAVAETTLQGGRNNVPGAVRVITVKDGGRIVEELLSYQAARRSLRYRIVESPLPVADYVSTLRVLPKGTGSRVVWSSRFQRAEQAEMDDAAVKKLIAGIYQAGFEGAAKALGPAPGKP